MHQSTPFTLPDELAKRGEMLLHQQCWCWGADIRRPEGNLLLEYGFSRERPPVAASGSTHYWKHLGGATIHLWGFGVLWEQPGGACYVNRYLFQPVLVTLDLLKEDIWSPGPFRAEPAMSSPDHRLIVQLSSICGFAAAYEHWVEREAGAEYRARILRDWDQTAVPASQFGAAWRDLADQLLRLAEDRSSQFYRPAPSL